MTIGVISTNSARRLVSGKNISKRKSSSKRYGGKNFWFLTFESGVSSINGLVPSSSGYLYITGTGTGGSYLGKIDPYGIPIYEKIVSSSSGIDIDMDSSGNLYMCDSGRRVIKLDEAANVLWTKILSSGGFKNISVDQSTGNVFVAINATVAADGNSGGNGFMCWGNDGTFNGGRQYTYANPSGVYNTCPLNKCFAAGGKIYTIGYSNQIDPFGTPDNGSYTGVYNKNNQYSRMYSTGFNWSSGSTVWDKFLREPTIGLDSAYSTFGTGIAVDSSDNSYVSFYRNPSISHTLDLGNGSIRLAKYNSSGALQWHVANGNAMGYGVTLDPNGNPFVYGYFSNQFGGDANAISFGSTLSGGSISAGLISGYSTSGTVLWQRSLTYKGSPVTITDIKVDSTSIYVCGNVTKNYTPGFVAKLPKDGSGTGNFWPFVYLETTPAGLARYDGTSFSDYTQGPGKYATTYTSGSTSTTPSNATKGSSLAIM
jgi:hypothetical protein